MRERTIKLAGAINLRDFGGYTTTDGRMVRRDRLYRSGALAALTPEAKQAFSRLGVSLICDLRREDERAREPTPDFEHAPSRLEIPISPGSSASISRQSGTRSLSLGERIDFMVEINRDLARNHTASYARMFEALLSLEQGGFLVHCSAGKDRTGFGCALILHALGVDRDTVLEDYLFTNTAMDFERYVQRLSKYYGAGDFDVSEEELIALVGVRAEYLTAAFEAIEAEFEGVEHYLEEAIGLDGAACEVLRQRFLL